MKSNGINTSLLNRVLVVDDDDDQHLIFNQILSPQEKSSSEGFQKATDDLFGSDETKVIEPNYNDPIFKIEHANQGDKAIEMIEKAETEGAPYSLVFMDVRMPPGLDGVQTTKVLWKKFPNIEIVFCSAYSDYSWADISKELGVTHNFLFVSKPYSPISIKQLAFSLCIKNKALAQIKNSMDDLQKKVDERTEELKEQKEIAVAASESKSKFLAAMSHEIRTPLNGIMGMNDLLMDSNLSVEQKYYSGIVKESCQSLMTVINDVLDISKIEAGKIELEDIPFNVCQLVENITDLFISKAEEKNINFVSLIDRDVNKMVYGDPGRIRQVLMNLCSNSIKFTENGDVSIHVKVNTIEKDKFLNFEVTDTGIGMQSDVLDSLFKEYSQADKSIARKYGGTGLGLNISYQLASLMGGNIKVKSEYQKGSVFNFLIKLKAIPEIGTKELESNLEGIKVVVISDNPASEEVFLSYLKMWGCVGLSYHPGEVNQAVIQEDVDIVLVDYRNVESGLKAAELLTNKGFTNIPFVFFLRVSQPGDGKIIQDHGFRSFLTKPIRRDHLKNIISLEVKGVVDQELPKLITKHFIEENFMDGKRILIAEDNMINLKVLSSMLKKLDIKYDIAKNGSEAVEAYKVNKYDLILMDCMMPVMDGLEATKQIRILEEKLDYKTPICALTADVVGDAEKDCIEAGMDEFLSKPVNKKDLSEMIKKILSGD